MWSPVWRAGIARGSPSFAWIRPGSVGRRRGRGRATLPGRYGRTTMGLRAGGETMNVRQWLQGPLLGAAIGLPILGGGGRLAMRGIAVFTGAPGAFTAEGTLTVLLLGAASGFGGG